MHRRLACPPYLVNESAFATRLRRTLPPSLFHCALKRRRERVRGIEPPCAAWEAAVLPLNYTRGAIFDFRFSIADCNRNKIADRGYRSDNRSRFAITARKSRRPRKLRRSCRRLRRQSPHSRRCQETK